jgi:hypothetical protein
MLLMENTAVNKQPMYLIVLTKRTRQIRPLIFLTLTTFLVSCTKPEDQQAFLATVWSKTWGGSLQDYGYELTVDQAGNYVFLTGANSSDGDVVGYGPGGYLVKLSPDGQRIWQKSIPGVDASVL